MTRNDFVRDLKATKPCECGKRMILTETELVYMSDPPQYPLRWQCFGCGSTDADAPVFRPFKSHMPTNEQRWRAAQSESSE